MLSRDEQLTFPDVIEKYNNGIWNTYELYIFHLHLLLKIAQQAEEDAKTRATKLLPSEEDKAFTPVLFTNPSTQSLANHVEFLNIVAEYKANENLDEDYLRKLYQAFEQSDEYRAFLEKEEPDTKDYNKVMLDMYRFMITQDLFTEMTEERFTNWDDDESLVVGAIKKSLKNMPVEGAFYESFQPSDDTVREFGEELLRKTCQEDEELFTHIEPTLKNWDAERVAALDMIMLKMALAELLFFPTIPTKVTLNEYVEISKQYSTEKSKEFINGILDRLMKKLIKEDKISKEGRGLVE